MNALHDQRITDVTDGCGLTWLSGSALVSSGPLSFHRSGQLLRAGPWSHVWPRTF